MSRLSNAQMFEKYWLSGFANQVLNTMRGLCSRWIVVVRVGKASTAVDQLLDWLLVATRPVVALQVELLSLANHLLEVSELLAGFCHGSDVSSVRPATHGMSVGRIWASGAPHLNKQVGVPAKIWIEVIHAIFIFGDLNSGEYMYIYCLFTCSCRSWSLHRKDTLLARFVLRPCFLRQHTCRRRLPDGSLLLFPISAWIRRSSWVCLLASEPILRNFYRLQLLWFEPAVPFVLRWFWVRIRLEANFCSSWSPRGRPAQKRNTETIF